MATLTFQLAHHFDAEPLLACVTMGLVLVNRRCVWVCVWVGGWG